MEFTETQTIETQNAVPMPGQWIDNPQENAIPAIDAGINNQQQEAMPVPFVPVTRPPEIDNQANGNQTAKEVPADAYPVDMKSIRVKGVNESAGYALVVNCAPLKSSKYEEYDKKICREYILSADGTEIPNYDSTKALEELFDEIVQSGTLINTEDGRQMEPTRDQLLQAKPSDKRSIADLHLSCTATVESTGGFDSFFNTGGTIAVSVKALNKFNFKVHVRPLTIENQRSLKNGLGRLINNRKNNQVIAKTERNPTKVGNIFNACFEVAENCLLNGVLYENNDKVSFVTALLPHVKEEIMTAVSRHYEESLGN